MIIHKNEDRGSADHGWLKAKHSFSFASWYNPDKIQFGALRVLNDDSIAAGAGFPTHPHDNMEIITIPLSGAIEHKDSMGNSGVITAGEVQVMSAGTGVYHSEYNHSKTDELKLFQIWIFPEERGVEPRYAQSEYETKLIENEWNALVGPKESGYQTWIHQQAWISLGEFDENQEIIYPRYSDESGIYLMIVDGEIEVNGIKCNARDAVGIFPNDIASIKLISKTRLLALEVPM